MLPRRYWSSTKVIISPTILLRLWSFYAFGTLSTLAHSRQLVKAPTLLLSTQHQHSVFLLMDVHQAAHGLHIASASRVFFVNPIWQPHVEAQAIKRAHRIGQTKPVYVETLVLENTLEDQMLWRRKGMTAQEHQKAEKSLLDDDTMSTIIKKLDFIPLPRRRNSRRSSTNGSIADAAAAVWEA